VIQLKRALNELKDKMFLLMRNKEIEKRGRHASSTPRKWRRGVEEKRSHRILIPSWDSVQRNAMGLFMALCPAA